MQGKGHFPLFHIAIHRRAFASFKRSLVDAVLLRFFADNRVAWVKNEVAMSFDELVVIDIKGIGQAISVIQDAAEISDTSDAGMKASRRLPRFQTRKTEDALFALSGRPVIVRLLIRAGRNTHSPAATNFLIYEDDAVFTAFVDSTGGTSSNASRIQTMIADAWEIKENKAFDIKKLLLLFGRETFEVRVILSINR